MTGQQHRDPIEPLQGGLYSRDEVMRVERWSWAGAVIGGHAEYVYDGIAFWRRLRDGVHCRIRQVDAPSRGWRHRPTCNCPLCTEHVAKARPAAQHQ